MVSLLNSNVQCFNSIFLNTSDAFSVIKSTADEENLDAILH